MKTIFKKTGFLAVWLLLVCLLFTGCGGKAESASASAAASSVTILPTGMPEEIDAFGDAGTSADGVQENGAPEAESAETSSGDETGTSAEELPAAGEESIEEGSEAVPEDADAAGTEETDGDAPGAELTVEKDGTYTSREEVALYIHTYGKLPSNYITKKKAEQLGWDSSRGNLWDVAPGMSIGGGHFGNYEGNLPDGDYRECDIDYEGGYRGAKRIVYSDDGRIYYTEDHYNTFEQLY